MKRHFTNNPCVGQPAGDMSSHSIPGSNDSSCNFNYQPPPQLFNSKPTLSDKMQTLQQEFSFEPSFEYKGHQSRSPWRQDRYEKEGAAEMTPEIYKRVSEPKPINSFYTMLDSKSPAGKIKK